MIDPCLVCGLCCDGTIFLSLKDDAGDRWGLPCLHRKESCCDIYENRPIECREYVCKLMTSDKENKLETINEAKRLINKTGLKPFRQGVSDQIESDSVTSETLDAVKFLNNNFHTSNLSTRVSKSFKSKTIQER